MEAMTVSPVAVDGELIQTLRDAGLDDEDIHEAASVGWQFNFITRAADAFDFEILTDEKQLKVAKVLQRMGKLFGSEQPTPYTTTTDGVLRPVELNEARTHLLHADGATNSDLRVAAEALGARLRGADRSDFELPPEWLPYLTKVALHAYKVVGEDIDELKAAGHDENVIFEVTMACAFGCATAGVEAVMAHLHDV